MTELGTFALIFALAVTTYGMFTAFQGGRKRRPDLVRSAENSILVNFVLLSIASAGLTYAFVARDFNVE